LSPEQPGAGPQNERFLIKPTKYNHVFEAAGWFFALFMWFNEYRDKGKY